MVTSDPLAFLTETTYNITANSLVALPTSSVDLNPLKIILNLFIVLILLFIAMKVMKYLSNKQNPNNQYILKEINIPGLFKVLFVKIGKKLYLIASNQAQIIHLDTIDNEKEIINILTSEESDPNLLKKLKKNSPSFNNALESSLKKILKNSEEIEDLS